MRHESSHGEPEQGAQGSRDTRWLYGSGERVSGPGHVWLWTAALTVGDGRLKTLRYIPRWPCAAQIASMRVRFCIRKGYGL